MKEPDFDIDQILLKILIKSDEFVIKQVRIMNTGDQQTTINVEVFGLLEIVKADSAVFTLKPGQTKVVSLNFSSFTEEQKLEQQPGVYIGKLIVKSEKASKEIPIVAEIESKNVLFDMNLNPVAIERKVKQGSDTTIEVRLFNLQSIESTNVDVEYSVKDMNGNTILTESETVVVKTQAYFSKTISIPKKLKSGPYVFAAQAKFGNSIGTASYLFEVVGPEIEASFVDFCKNSILCLGLSLTTILLLFALTAYFYFFIGAYLYERVTGIVTLPRKKEEKSIERVESDVIEIPGIFETIKEKLKELLSSAKLKKFYKILDKSKEAINSKDISKSNKLFIDARDLYIDLADGEKQEVYDKLLKLHEQLNQLMREKKYKEKLRVDRELEKQKLTERQRKLEAVQREEGKRRLEEQVKKKEEELRKQKEIDTKQREEEKKRIMLQREKLRQERKEKIREFFHKIGLHKTPEEKEQIALQKEKGRLEKLRKKDELKGQRELKQRQKEQQRLAEDRERKLENAKQEEEIKKRQERLELKKELEKKEPPEKKVRWFETLLRKEKPELKLKDVKTTAEEIPALKKPGIFARLFKKIKKEEEKTKDIKSQKSEFEELEESIRNLGLFKKIEKKEFGVKERSEEAIDAEKKKTSVEKTQEQEHAQAKESIFGGLFSKIKKKEEPEELKGKDDKKMIVKSKKLEKFYKSLNKAKEAIYKNDMLKAEKLYAEARYLYVDLGYEEKKMVYSELTNLYSTIKNL